MTDGELRVAIRSDADILAARRTGRELATSLGFPSGELALIATAISEVARNIVLYALHGELRFHHIQDGRRQGLVIVAEDHGPGIANIELAMQDGFSTGGSLGLGLPGARRMMDEFEITSAVGKGTTITMRKWLGGSR
jgi:serine/threonine-protein kinase RsbT